MAKNCGSGTGIVTRPCFRGNLGSKTLDVGRSREKRWIRGLPNYFNPLCGPKPLKYILSKV